MGLYQTYLEQYSGDWLARYSYAFATMLRADVAAASGKPQLAVQMLKAPSSGDTQDVKLVLYESLAHIHQQMGDQDGAIYWYGQFLQGGDQPIAAWETAVHLSDAYYWLAADNFNKGNRAASQQWLTKFQAHWKNADANLPLMRRVSLLRGQLVGLHFPGSTLEVRCARMQHSALECSSGNIRTIIHWRNGRHRRGMQVSLSYHSGLY